MRRRNEERATDEERKEANKGDHIEERQNIKIVKYTGLKLGLFIINRALIYTRVIAQMLYTVRL